MIRLAALIVVMSVSCSAVSADLNLGSHRVKHRHTKEFLYGAPPVNNDGPLWWFTDSSIQYIGGFRVSAQFHGPNAYSSADSAQGVFTLAEDGNSIFLSGNTAESQMAEFQLPALVNTTDQGQMNVAQPIQNFSLFNDPGGRYDPGIPNFLRITGMYTIGGKLIVNYFNNYDNNVPTDPDTTAIYQDAENLATTNIVGPFRMEGKSHSGGWISPIPTEWQTRLGATHVSGWAQGSIDNRLSIGPSAYFWNPADYLDDTVATDIATTKALDYPLTNILHKDVYQYSYDHSVAMKEWMMLNFDLRNDLWTYGSGAAYGFIIPGSNTYMTIGYSSGHESGIGYKYQRPTGSPCAGACAKDIDDYYNYYWLFKVSDLEEGMNGDIEPYSIRPYSHGKFPTIGLKSKLKGGYFNATDGKLYVALETADTVSTIYRPPLFLAYQMTY